ncbi:MAG: heat-inducible transcriptional repressor HrcA [Myxococcota bacterium]|jgi:heat-inducible transcriptional repressor|nr:heat-inducible transcriptional repressor HrcA [Myxococcota bacterium]
MDKISRNHHILELTVETYLKTGQPISSAELAKRLKRLKLSTATIRHILMDLEQQGYLEQPHKSSGRLPTEKGLRFYLDHLQQLRLHRKDRHAIDHALCSEHMELVPQVLGQSLSLLSGQLALIALPDFSASRFEEIALLRYGKKQFLACIVLQDGLVQQKRLDMKFDLNDIELQHIQNLLNERLANRTLNEAKKLIEAERDLAREQARLLEEKAYLVGSEVLPAVESNIFVFGRSHLVRQPDCVDDLEQLPKLLEAIEENEILLKLIDCFKKPQGTRVLLSSEHQVDSVSALACIGGTWAGSEYGDIAIGLLGPKRMNYGRLLPMVDYATRRLGGYWNTL